MEESGQIKRTITSGKCWTQMNLLESRLMLHEVKLSTEPATSIAFTNHTRIEFENSRSISYYFLLFIIGYTLPFYIIYTN